MSVDLSEVDITDLLHEVQRRIECQTKPEKKVILIGMCAERSALSRPACPTDGRADFYQFSRTHFERGVPQYHP
jgi:hypothetical protein